MFEANHPSHLLTEVAPLLDLDTLAEHEGEESTSWDLLLPDGLLIEAFHDSGAEKLVFTSDLGAPPASHAGALCRLFLQYNYLWRETSGVRMAMEPPSGSIVMIYDLPLAGLDTVLLRNVLQNFAATARTWALYLADPGPETEAVTLESLQAEDPAGRDFLIRV
jgi:hypothetical protein